MEKGENFPKKNAIGSSFYFQNEGYRGSGFSEVKVQRAIPNKTRDTARKIAEASLESMYDNVKDNEKMLKLVEEDKYLNKKTEAFARAFETYVSDKLQEKGMKNTYLSSHAKTKDRDGAFVYPQGEKRNEINKMFDAFFDQIRKTDELKKAIDKFLKKDNIYIKKYNPFTNKFEYKKAK